MNKIKEIKVFYQHHFKKFLLPVDFDSLVITVCSSFCITKDNICFNYIDDEGDKIAIANQFDYEQLIHLIDKSQNFKLKMNVEKSKLNDTINTPIEQSLLILNSQLEDDFSYKDDFGDLNSLKYKIKNLIRTEIEEKFDNFKNKLVLTLDNKLNSLLTHGNIIIPSTGAGTRRHRSCTNLKSTKKKENKNLLDSSHGVINLNSNISSVKANSPKHKCTISDRISCSICGNIINSFDRHYNCLQCDDVFMCLTCHNQSHSSKHILMQIKNPDEEHLNYLHSVKNFKRHQDNKKRFLKDRDKYYPQFPQLLYEENYFNSLIAFNNLTDKIVIEIDLKKGNKDFNTSDTSNALNDLYNMKFNFVNLWKEDIKTGSYLECIFDQSDIFGNKVLFEEIVKGFGEFELSIMFYNFKNKPSGFYISKWRLLKGDNKAIKNKNTNPFQQPSIITFIFYLKTPYLSNEDIFNIDFLKEAQSNSHKKEIVIATQSKDMDKIKANNQSVKFPDLYMEIIKKHQQSNK